MLVVLVVLVVKEGGDGAKTGRPIEVDITPSLVLDSWKRGSLPDGLLEDELEPRCGLGNEE